jgi:transposase
MRRHSCKGCRQRDAELAQLRARTAVLEEQVRQLQEKLAVAQKNSSTSSKPPSSDIVKPPPAGDASGPRSAGGQPGHPKHERAPFPAEQVTHFEEHVLDACPGCGGRLRRNAHFAHIVQQIDIARPPLTIEQHTSPEYWCERCQRSFKAPMPLVIDKGGLVGPQLTALIAYMKGACHASYSTVRTFLRDVVVVTISRGELSKIVGKVTAALDKPYEELLQALPNEAWVNVDETGHKDNGDKWWTWCFRAELYTLYRIDAYRDAEVLMATLGKEFGGILGCDYFSAYRRYMKECSIQLQFCLAHLIRDVKFLTTLPDERDAGSRAAARFAVSERPAHTPPWPAERRTLRQVAGRLQAVVRQRTRLINQFHHLLALSLPELALLIKDLSTGWVLELVHRYPTAQLLAAATPHELGQIPYLPDKHIEALPRRASERHAFWRCNR